MAKLENILRGIVSVLDIWPDTDYSISLPPPTKVHSPVDRMQIIASRVSNYFYSSTSIDNFRTIYGHIKLLKERNFQIRARAVQALGKMAEAAIPALIEALRDRDGRVRAGAAEALGQMRARAEVAIPALSEALRDEGDNVRVGAAGALSWIGEAAIPALIPIRNL